MSKTKIGRVLGDLPKPSLEKSSTEILEHGEKVDIKFDITGEEKKVILGVQSTENSWSDCTPVLSFNGFVKMEEGIFPCVGMKTAEETVIMIL